MLIACWKWLHLLRAELVVDDTSRRSREGKLMNLIKRCDDNWFGLRRTLKRAKSICEHNILISHDYREAC